MATLNWQQWFMESTKGKSSQEAKMFRFKKTLLAAGVALAMAWASPATADTILFNPTGGGAVGAIEVDSFDQAVGNALAQDVTVLSPTPTDFTLLYQSNLAQATAEGTGVVFTQGDGGDFFTFSAGFGETLTTVIPNADGGATLLFAFDDSEPNFFEMYATNTDGDNLAGTGFSTGTLILSGHAIPDGFVSTFTFPDDHTEDLDRFGDDDYPNTDTLVGAGVADVQVAIDFVHAGYFPTIALGTIIDLAITSSTLRLPFNTVDPSACFLECAVVGVGSVGTINALTGPNTILQADASSSFKTAQVPEPGMLTLLGLGLLGVSARLRNRRA